MKLARAAAGVVALAATLVGGPAQAERGIASWYGGKFHGRQTASGERYDKEDMTAAHRTLPFGTLVRVENLDNGREAVLRVNDRGPFVHGRILDCSERGARELGFHVAGTCKVRLEVLGQIPDGREPRGKRLTKKERKRLERELERMRREHRPDVVDVALLEPVDPDAGPFEVQVGAFQNPRNAERLARRLEEAGHGARIVETHEGFLRVRVGPYATRAAAERAAPSLRADEPPFIVRAD